MDGEVSDAGREKRRRAAAGRAGPRRREQKKRGGGGDRTSHGASQKARVGRVRYDRQSESAHTLSFWRASSRSLEGAL